MGWTISYEAKACSKGGGAGLRWRPCVLWPWGIRPPRACVEPSRLNSTSNSHPKNVGQTWVQGWVNKKTIFSPKWRLNCARSTKVLMARVFLQLKDETRLWPDYSVGF